MLIKISRSLAAPQKYILVSFVCQLNVPVHFAFSYTLQNFGGSFDMNELNATMFYSQLQHLQRSKSLCATNRIQVLYNRTKIAFVSTALHLFFGRRILSFQLL